MTIMRRLQTQHEAFHGPSKSGKASSASKPLATTSNGPKTRQAAPLDTGRKLVVLVSPASKETAKQAIITISDSEDELAKDDYEEGDLGFPSSASTKRTYVPVDNDMFMPYELTYNSTRAGHGRKR
jgi:hypothetical protein